jgi:hypothetical protein
MRTITATRYVTPFREGGSMPALVEADDDGQYVLKFRGAGQRPRALVAELIAGELARALGLPVPEVVLCELDPRIGVAEPDPEIQELLQASAGLNVALDFLPGSLAFTDPETVDPARAADIVWLDSLVMNVDRTPRNPNLLAWHGSTWLIDHGAAFYRHHRDDSDPGALAVAPFPLVAQHVLLERAGSLLEADARLRGLVDEALLQRLGALVPDGWADPAPYVDFLRARVAASAAFAQEADDARP